MYSGFEGVEFCIIGIICGISVIIKKNPILSLMSLISLFASISLYLIFLGLTYIGFSYLIVYIGAVSILFIFILMLIDIRISELQSNNLNSIPLALFVMLLLNNALQPCFANFSFAKQGGDKIINMILGKFETWIWGREIGEARKLQLNTGKVILVTSNNWDGNMTETSHMSTIGNILYTSYNIWLFIASIILLLGMTGAIIITIKQDTDKQ